MSTLILSNESHEPSMTMQLDYPYHPPVIATFLSWPGMSQLLLWLVSLPHPGLQDKCPEEGTGTLGG